MNSGIYIEEIERGVKPIVGVDPSTAIMVGVTERGPEDPTLVTSLAEFRQKFGGAIERPPLSLRDQWLLDPNEGGQWWQLDASVQGFFENGGRRLYIKRIGRDNLDDLSADDFVVAIESLKEVDDFGLCLAPGLWSTKIQNALIALCEELRSSFAVLDTPNGLDVAGARNFRRRVSSAFAALYYPWIEVATGAGTNQIAPSGHVAGIYARVDQERGVHNAPANEVIRGITRIVRDITDADQKLLSPEGINALRFLPDRGNLVWGARTLSPDSEWRYVNVRRLFIFLEQSIEQGTKWVVFEPNNEKLWSRVRQTINDFLITVWREGAVQGNKPEAAFFVTCDRTTMTQNDIDNGRLICVIGVAPLKPAEFVIFRIGQWTVEHNT